MPRDPKDISFAANQRTQRRIGELEDQKDPIRIRVGAGPGGPEGAEGPAGEDGSTWFSGSGAPAGGLGVNGDFYLNTLNEDVYEKSGGSWSVITNIKGEKGATGATGEDGINGKEGPAGSAENIDWKNSVRCATTANIATATALNPGDVLDGVTLAENDRVLVKDQTTKSQNGIWVVKATPARALDADAVAELSGGSTIYVEEGTRNKRRTFQIITPGNITPGTTAHEYQQLGFRDFGLVETTLPTAEAIKNDKCSFIAGTGAWDLVFDGEWWRCVGGAPLYAENETLNTTNSATYVSLTGALKITAPLEGDYDITIEALLETSAGGEEPLLSYAVGATAASDAWAARHFISGATGRISLSASKRHSSVAKSAAIEEKMRRVFSSTVGADSRRLTVMPVRVK